MSSSVDASLIASLNNVSALLNRYLAIVIFVLATVGNVLNCLVFSQGVLRSNPCAFFFLVSSIANLIFVFAGLTTRMLTGWIVDAANTTAWLCKLRTFVLYSSRTTALWLIMLATVDRWLLSCSNTRYRQMSTMKNAYRHMVLTLTLSALLYAHLLYCYEANLTNTPLPCYSKTTQCRIITDMFDICITVVIPLVLMIIFGVMTISNVRQIQRRLRPLPIQIMNSTSNSRSMILDRHQQRWKKTDRHLLAMLFFQVTVLILLTVPYSCVKMYSTLTAMLAKSPLQIAIDNFVFNFALLLAFLSCGVPFYIYTLCSGSVFRSALLNIVKYVGRKMRCQRN